MLAFMLRAKKDQLDSSFGNTIDNVKTAYIYKRKKLNTGNVHHSPDFSIPCHNIHSDR